MSRHTIPPLTRTTKPYGWMGRTSSINQQREGTIDAQLDDWHLFCSRNDIDPVDDVHYFLDDGVSGAINIWDRPQGAYLKEWIEEGYITRTIYTNNADRVNREDRGSMDDLIDLCHDYGLNYATVKDGVNTADPGGETWALIKAEISRDENRRRTENFISGKRRKARDGFWIASRTPYGHRKDADNRLELDPYQATVILEWKRLIEEEGYSLRKLAAYSTERGYVSASGRTDWTHMMVWNYLANTSLYGEAQYNKTRTVKRRKKEVRLPRAADELIIVPCPAIMPRAEWERLHATIKRNAQQYQQTGAFSEFLMLSSVFCAICGQRYYAAKHRYNRPQYDKSYLYYNYRHDWTTAKGKACRPSKQTPGTRLDKAIWEQVVMVASDPEHLRAALQKDAPAQVGNDLALAAQRHRDAKNALEDLDNRFWVTRQLKAQQYDALLPRLQSELEAAERALKQAQQTATQESTRLERIDTLIEVIEEYRALVLTATHEEKREICKTLIGKVWYDYRDDSHRIEWAL
jgi:recombinase/resolvase-like protein